MRLPYTFAVILGLSVATANAGILVPDLLVTKTSTPEPVVSGDNVVYTVTIQNIGGSDANAVSVTDTLPLGTGWIVSNAPAFSGCTNPGLGNAGTVTCNMATPLASTASVTITITAVVTASGGSVLTNTATATSNPADFNSANNTGTAITTVVAAGSDLAITKTAGTGPFTAGANVPFTITVTNNGPSSATAVTVTDTLQTGATFVSSTPSQGSCSGTATVTCSLGTMASGASASIALVVQSSGTAGTLTNTASVSSTSIDPAPVNNLAVAAVTTVGAVIPTLSSWMLIALMISIGLAGAVIARR